jgi:DNA-binding transcriptional LysR family regulator
MELRHLRYFCAAADEAHIHRAAERLAIAQPALTHQIKALEAELGVKLFARAGRGVVVTEAGRIFQAEARAILDHVDRATALMRQVDAGRVGRLRVGFTESASFSPVLMDLLKRFRQAWPAVECVLEESHTEGLVEALEQGKLDVVFVRPPLRTTRQVAFEALASEPMMVALPTGHPLAEAESLSIAELEAQEFVVYPRRHGFGLSDAVMAECRRAGYVPKIAQQTPQLSATINLVAAGMGIAVVPECMRHQRPDSVRFVTLTGTDLRAELGLAHRRDNPSRAPVNLIEAALAARDRR